MLDRREPTRVHLYRHAQTEVHGGLVISGARHNPGLSEIGKQEAHALAQRTADIVVYTDIHSSPYRRTHATAEALATAHGFTTIKEDRRIGERDFGAFESLVDEADLVDARARLDVFWKSHPDARLRRSPDLPEDMESDSQLLERLYDYLFELPPGGEIAANAHWDDLSTLTLHHTGRLISPENTGEVELLVRGSKIEVVKLAGYKEVLRHDGYVPPRNRKRLIGK